MLNGTFSNWKETVQDNWFFSIPSKAVSTTIQLSNFLSNYARALSIVIKKDIITESFVVTDRTAVTIVRSMCFGRVLF